MQRLERQMRTKLGYVVLGLMAAGIIAALFLNPMIFFVLLLSGLIIGVSVLLFSGPKTVVYKQPKVMSVGDDDSLEDDIRHHDYGYGGFGTDHDEKHD
ncbi:MAG: hypothetical protein EB055_05320 [Micrococcales bacterium]|nr:hypothetical protein [Micrococcales bacterium]